MVGQKKPENGGRCVSRGLWISTAKKFSGSRWEHPILGDLKMKGPRNGGTMVSHT
jgi:hypothetical protein